MFSTKQYDKNHFNLKSLDMTFLSPRLNKETANLAEGFDVVCCFVNDNLNAVVLKKLKNLGVKLIALRCAGFNNVDLKVAQELKIAVCRVPEYSPYAVAEHACALILDLNRHIHRAHNRIRENDYSLDGLLGFDLHGKTVGVVGAGKIGLAFAKIMSGFGCRILIHDPYLSKKDLQPDYIQVTFDELLIQSDVISLHCPLTKDTHHIIDEQAIELMKPSVMLINTSRGGLVDTVAIIKALKLNKIGYLGIDVYEEESEIFFEDLSETFIQDDVFARLQTFPNVIITGHQAFFTEEALSKIAETTESNILNYFSGRPELSNIVSQ